MLILRGAATVRTEGGQVGILAAGTAARLTTASGGVMAAWSRFVALNRDGSQV